MEGVVLVSDIVWVKRGVPKQEPEKVELDAEQIKELIQGGTVETSDQGDSDDGGEEGFGEEKRGLRGSNGDVKEGEVRDEDAAMKEYMREYEEESDAIKASKGDTMRGIAMYATPFEDPLITRHTDSDEDEEKEDLMVKSDDNFVVSAKVDRGAYSVEVHVYNERAGDWYVHHDYLLESPPLCLESFHYDPGVENKRGNLLAVGTISGTVEIWDLDIMNSCEPAVILGEKAKGKRKKRDGRAQGHTEAVLSCKWNSLTPHVMASGDAEGKLILWDIDEAKAASVIDARGEGGLQSLHWHPVEEAVLLTGSMGGVVSARDCRSECSQATWQLPSDVQVEKVVWQHWNPFAAVVATSDGHIHALDMRRTGEFVFSVNAHEGAVEGLSLSSSIHGLAATGGADGSVVVWRVSPSTICRVHESPLPLGPIHSLAFSPNSPSILCIGGEKGELTKIVDVMKWEEVATEFTSQA